ncbi:MAG TPA: DUF2934 domain-containing protein [Gemmatimonadaceae bacterium]|nr:DUF2934 domain-containing protein [Gemmatimonadaceae bacterium]
MPRGEKSLDTGKQQRQSTDSESGYVDRGISSEEADRKPSTSANDTMHGEKSVPLSTSIEPDAHAQAAADGTPDAFADSTLVDLDSEIRRKAYEIFLSRSADDGDAITDWLAAERVVRASQGGVDEL